MKVAIREQELIGDIRRHIETMSGNQTEFAKLVGVDKSTISLILKGGYPMGELVLIKICSVLGYPINKYIV